jgi:hypothetical protein
MVEKRCQTAPTTVPRTTRVNGPYNSFSVPVPLTPRNGKKTACYQTYWIGEQRLREQGGGRAQSAFSYILGRVSRLRLLWKAWSSGE